MTSSSATRATIHWDGDGVVTRFDYSDGWLFGGDDTLFGGSGDDVLRGDGEVSPPLSNYGIGTLLGDGEVVGIVEGGDDTLVGGRGADILRGDVRLTDPPGSRFTGGADSFVFGARGGLDIIMDFRRGDGDRLDLIYTGLDWNDLDSNGNGRLDAGDDFVGIAGGGTRIDLGHATGAAEGRQVVTVSGVTGLQESDFVLA